MHFPNAVRVQTDERLTFRELRGAITSPSFCDTVQAGLSAPQKSLPSRFFYDAAGSHLFEQITELPEYYLTKAELRILEMEALPILAEVGVDVALVEFGSGSSRKTRLLIEAALARQNGLLYAPIDISRDFLRASSEELLEQYPRLKIHALAAEYTDAIGHMPDHRGPRLILFLGSNIGNFDHRGAVEFLSSVRRQMRPHDRLLIGADLVKDPGIVELAYNDPQGVTSEFNKNVLRRINRELDGDFDLGSFKHSAPYIASDQRVEMRLISRVDQQVEVEAIGSRFDFAAGEHILTEYCQKYTLESLGELSSRSGLTMVRHWHDPKQWFTLALLAPEVG